jgi:hypothetical protein
MISSSFDDSIEETSTPQATTSEDLSRVAPPAASIANAISSGNMGTEEGTIALAEISYDEAYDRYDHGRSKRTHTTHDNDNDFQLSKRPRINSTVVISNPPIFIPSISHSLWDYEAGQSGLKTSMLRETESSPIFENDVTQQHEMDALQWVGASDVK